MYKKILIPTDGSENAKRAAKHAVELASKDKANIIILHIIEEFTTQTAVLPISTLPEPCESICEELNRQGEEIIQDIKEEILETCPGNCENITITSLITYGKPYLEILKVMQDKDVDLVLMGASGRHGLDRVILGSVTERVVRESTKPLMIIP